MVCWKIKIDKWSEETKDAKLRRSASYSPIHPLRP